MKIEKMLFGDMTEKKWKELDKAAEEAGCFEAIDGPTRESQRRAAQDANAAGACFKGGAANAKRWADDPMSNPMKNPETAAKVAAKNRERAKDPKVYAELLRRSKKGNEAAAKKLKGRTPWNKGKKTGINCWAIHRANNKSN